MIALASLLLALVASAPEDDAATGALAQPPPAAAPAPPPPGGILGTNGQAQNSGTFDVAGEIVTFNRVNGQINITLTDPNGSQTQVSAPAPQF
jgi:hypothetical protein